MFKNSPSSSPDSDKWRDRSILITEDGSATLKLNRMGEHYHSVYGAWNESMHIYIEAGLKAVSRENIRILEVGFGTGLNTILTLVHKGDKNIFYHAIEAYPLTEEEVSALNYCRFLPSGDYPAFQKLHSCAEGEIHEMANGFSFIKEIRKLEDTLLEAGHYDLVYFDAFSPDFQEELWEEAIFSRLYTAMRKEAVLVTYCAKGRVKRALKKTGFRLESLPGPRGKREIIRCVKI